MNLTLTVSGGPRPGLRVDRNTFTEDGGSVGRDPGCTWVLPDPRSVLSGQHLWISAASDAFYVTDLSRNGTYLNDEPEPIGRDQSRWLSDGDRLRLGDYELVVGLAAAPAAAAYPTLGGAEAGGALLAGPGANADPLAQLGPAAKPRGARVSLVTPRPGQDELADLFEDAAEPGDQPLLDPAPRNVDPLAAVPVPREPTAPATAPVASGGAALIPENWLAKAGPELQLPPPRAARETAPAPPADDAVALLRQRQAARGRTAPDGPSVPMAPQGEEARLLAALWTALGVDPQTLTPEQKLAFMGELGRSVRAVALGLIQLLTMRKSTKGEFELEQTMVRARENNLFKFASNADELLTLALTNRGGTFMPLDRAVEGSFDDIKANELATIAAVQISIRSVIDRFQPQKLVDKVREKEGRQLFTSFKASCWDYFNEVYGSLAADADEASSRLFTAEFGRAYRERVVAMQAPAAPRPHDRS